MGLTTGSAYALVALGLVAVHRGTGIVNFAQGAIGMASTYAFWKLHAHAGVPLWPAIAAGLVVGVGVSVAFYGFVGRRLVGASTTTKTLVTLGLLLMLEAVVRIAWTNQQERVGAFLVSGSVSVLGVRIQALTLVLLLTAVVLTTLLTLLFSRTRFGHVTTALQDSPMGAQALGYSPHPWGAAAWAISGLLAALAGILLSPVTALSPISLTSLVIPALGAALIASFRHFWVALAVALAAGAAESLAVGFGVEAGLGKSIPYIVTVLALVVAGRKLPGRGTVDAPRLFRVGSGDVNKLGLIVASLAIVLVAYALPDYWSDILAFTAIFGLIGLSAVISAGYAGQVSLLPLGLTAVSMLLAGWVSQHGAPLLATLGISLLAAGAFGLLVGLPAARLRGVGLTVATLAIAAIIETWIYTTERFLNGVQGWKLAEASLFGVSLDNALHPQRFALLCWAVAILAGLATASLRRSRAGRRLLAMRSNERAAAACGIAVPQAKVAAFALSASLCGLAGALLALQAGTVGGQRFGEGFMYADSLAVLSMTVLGGAGYVIGGLLAGVFSPGGIIPQILSFGPTFNDWLALLLALNLVFVLISEPDGVVAQVLRGLARLRNRRTDAGSSPAADAGPARLSQAEIEAALQPARRSPPGAIALAVEDLAVRYGETVVVSGVSFELSAGAVLGVLGPNGAGKSSLIDALSGFVAADGGRVLILGEDVARLEPHQRARRGLVRTFQDHLLFEDLTVRENLLAAADRDDPGAYLTGPFVDGSRGDAPTIRAAAQLAGATPYLDTLAEALSLGWHARVTLARALAARPTVLCLDEPAAALSPDARTHVIATIRAAARDLGIAILLVEHNIDVVREVCDQVLVMDAGRIIARGAPAEVLRRADVRRAYLGEMLDEASTAHARGLETVA